MTNENLKYYINPDNSVSVNYALSSVLYNKTAKLKQISFLLL